MSYNTRKQKVTQQTLSEDIYMIRGTDEGRPVWRSILAPAKKIFPIKSLVGEVIDTNEIGRAIQYRDELGRVNEAAGWGKNPPDHLGNWLSNQYGTNYLIY